MQGAEAGSMDDVIGDVIPIVEAELFGQVSEEKEANAFVGGCKEAKRLRAYATYQLLARGVTFRDHMSTLLQPVRPRPEFSHRNHHPFAPCSGQIRIPLTKLWANTSVSN